jgi:hypothetical protein
MERWRMTAGQPRRRESIAARRVTRLAGLLALSSALSLGGWRRGGAQNANVSTREGIALRLHPHVGDTLHTRLEQLTEIAAGRAGSSGARPMTTSVMVLARTIVQASRQATTTVLTLVDSADVRSSDAHGAAMTRQAERALRGQQLVLQLAEDGSVESARDARGVAVPRDVAETMAAMPAVFPHRPVALGERWRREMPLPSAGPLGTSGNAQVRAEFRLDSLGRSGQLAFVSMHGEIVSDGDARGLELSGSMRGAMQVDRARGWMTDSHFTLVIRSTVSPPGAAGMPPMKFVTRVTQHLWTMDKR